MVEINSWLIFGVFLKKNKKILLIGGSGILGSAIINSKKFKNLDYPSKKKLDLLKKDTIKKYLKKNYNLIINCAALARMKECEKNPSKAVNINIFGTANLVKEIINYQSKYKKEIKLIHMSSDGVYPSLKGNYKENSFLMPYNIYGWTKLSSEFIVKMLDDFIIIRTKFFDKNKIRFNTAPTDAFSSMMEVQDLVSNIANITNIKYSGVLNIGDKKRSEYNHYKRFSSLIRPCKRKDINKGLNFKIAKDSSLDLKFYNNIKNKLWKKFQ